MSAYLFGKLFVDASQVMDLKRRLLSLAKQVDVGVSLDVLDEDDQQAIDSLIGAGQGVVFSVSTRAGGGDASGLWAEAQELAFSLLAGDRGIPPTVTPKSLETIKWPQDYTLRMSACRLHRILQGIALLPDYNKMSVAFTEGGIEAIHEDTAGRCIEAILRMIVLPWDCTPGTLYLWSIPVGVERSRLRQDGR